MNTPTPDDLPAEPGHDGPPMCHRHPDRQTHIRCARCDRAICTDCMVSAAVGFQCPDCVRSGRSTVREPRTVAGGKENRSPARVTRTLLGLNLAVYLLVVIVGDRVVDRLMLIGSANLRGEHIGVAAGEWYRLVTAGFLHQQVMHILFNMVSLWFLGPPLERVLGHTRFALLYLVSLVGGTALSYLVAPSNQGSLGASGAVFGMLGAMIVVGRRMRYDPRPLVVLLVLNLVITFTNSDTIDWRAHIGGLVAGTLSALGFMYAPARGRALVQAAVVVGLLVVVLVIDLVRTGQLS